MSDFSPYQRKVIQRYYRNIDTIQRQRLGEIVGDLYLAEGRKRERLWTQAEASLRALEIPDSRITHILTRRDPALLAALLEEIDRTPGGA